MIRFDQVTKRYPRWHGGRIRAQPEGGRQRDHGAGRPVWLRQDDHAADGQPDDRPDVGAVWVDGRDTASIRPTELRRSIGYVIQQGGLFPHKTVADNIATVPRLTGQGRHRARARALEMLERVGLPADFAERYPAQLSGGQQQRVGVARALAADPPVMLMDEPFSAVDPVVRDQLQNEFLRLQSDLGKTIIFVTHDIDEAIKLGDHVAVMRTGGTLAQFAAPAELLSRPADAFAAGFVGRDRGYRALGFAAAGSLPLAIEHPVRLGDPLTTAREREREGWVLAVDDDERPSGWLAAGGLTDEALSGNVQAGLLNLGGTLATETGTLREALDAALSSPSGRGVIVDQDGRLAGTVTASQVLSSIEARAEHIREVTVSTAGQRVIPAGTGSS